MLPKVQRSHNSIENSISKKTTDPQPSSDVQFERGKEPYLVFKDAPPSFNITILTNLCSTFGQVLRARQYESYNMYFVNFATLKDLFNVLEGLKSNSFGMTIELGNVVVNKLAKPQPPVDIRSTIDRIQQKSKDDFNNNNALEESD